MVKQRKLELENEINHLREEMGKDAFEYEDETERKEIKISKIDSDSGYYHRDEKEKGFMYLDHRTVDGLNNFIVDAYVTPGNVHDSKPYISRVEYILNKYGFHTKNVGLDSGYYSWDILESLEKKDIYGVVAYRRFNKASQKGFKYNEENDVYVCPIGCVLPLKNIDKLGYKQYHDSKQCQGCPLLQSCAGKSNKKVMRRHIKQEVYERAKDRRLSNHGKQLYARRKTTVERSFADSEQNHGYRYATYRGLAKVQNYVWLSCAVQNMKKMALLLHEHPQETLKPSLKLIKFHFEQLISCFLIHKRKSTAYKSRTCHQSVKMSRMTHLLFN